MSILIKGIDLPKDAQAVQISYWTKDGHYITGSYPPSRIVEIPTPHGRLGDLDVLLEESLKEGAYNYVDSWQIAEQPTILEAEE